MRGKVKRVFKISLCMLLALTLAAPSGFVAKAGVDDEVYVGVAKSDITGPVTDISTGYNSMGDLMEGLLTRLYARAFVVESKGHPVVFVSAELVHMTESIKPGVLAALSEDGYTCFGEENVMLTATHCHSSTSNTSWFALYDLINGVSGYDDESYKVIVKGIKEAIEAAYDCRVPGSVSFVSGLTDIKASNRSADAFLANYDAPEYGYEIGEDGSFSYETGLLAAQNAFNSEMAGIVLTSADGKDIGFLNFFGSHGTSNGIENRLVASDHKGYAALRVEEKMGDGFVAAFAQADSGDTSPNMLAEDYHDAFLRPADEDSSLDVIENQIVYGNQEAQAALSLLSSAERVPLGSDFDFNYTVVDFSDITVDLGYVGRFSMPYDDLSKGYVKTSEPCIGAGIIAGDEEGAPVDNAVEGTVRHKFVYNTKTGTYKKVKCDFKMIDLGGLQYILKPLWPIGMKILSSDKYDDAQVEKVVCLAVGNYMQKAQPLQIIRLGSVAFAGVPFELTYAQAGRTRAALLDTLGACGVNEVVIATHANAYSQYVTTREEYAAQHYEGSTCLFGPWSGAALTQELDKLAAGLVSGQKAQPSAKLMQTEPSGLLYTSAAKSEPAVDSNYGKLTTDVAKKTFGRGEWVTASFAGVNPRHLSILRIEDNDLAKDYSFMEVQRLENGEWKTVRTDTDPYTTYRCTSSGLITKKYAVTVGWLLKGENLKSGTYRLVYNGIARTKSTKWLFFNTYGYEKFSVASSEFEVVL